MTWYIPHTHYIAFPIEMYKKKNTCGLNCRYAGADEKLIINSVWPDKLNWWFNRKDILTHLFQLVNPLWENVSYS